MSSDSQAQQSTQIPVPISLISASNALPPLTSHLLIAHLRATSTTTDLNALLADSLARTGWTDRVRALALELLRNGTCDNFPDLLEEVLRRAKLPKNATSDSKNGDSQGTTNKTGGKSIPNGTTSSQSSGPTSAPGSQSAGASGSGAIAVREGWFGPDGLPDVKIPENTLEQGVDFLKERIQDLIEVVNDKED